MGHDADARKILAERERLLKIEARKSFRKDTDPPSRNYIVALGVDVRCLVHWVLADKLLQGLIGYGHHPFRSLVALSLLILAAIVPAHYAYDAGDFAPNSAVIQTSDGWEAALSADNPAEAWSDKAGQAGRPSTAMLIVLTWSSRSSISARPKLGRPPPRAGAGAGICGGQNGCFQLWAGSSQLWEQQQLPV